MYREDAGGEDMITMEKERILNSYEGVIREYGITEERFYEVGIKMCLFAPREAAREDWRRLRARFITREKPGMMMRMVVHEEWLRVFYRELFSLELVKDPDGNQAPNTALCELLGIRKPLNYVCVHIYGGTNNPLLFNALFNVCYIPAIYAPLTTDNRHKMTELHREFRRRFMARVEEMYGEMIGEYNELLSEMDVLSKIDAMNPAMYPKRFIANIREQWLPLPMSCVTA